MGSDGTDADRRQFIRAGVGTLIVSLAGCGGDGGGPTRTTTTTGQSARTTTTGTPSDTASDAPTGTDAATRTGTRTATPTDTPTGTPTPRQPEFAPLFDGSSLSGWHRTFGNAEYAVRDGAGAEEPYVVVTADSNTSTSFLSTYEVFDDFVLALEVWVDPDGLNSGIMFRSNTSQDRQKLYGPQIEVELSGGSAQLTPGGESGYVYGTDLGTGWISDKQSHEVFNNGEWNRFRIRVEGERVRTWINDEPIEDLDLAQYDVLPMGVVALQAHGGSPEPREVRFRNVRIKELDVQEWTRLFNGRNTNGWTNPLGRGTVSVSDGQLRLSGDQPFLLFTEEAFEDFLFETWVKTDAEGGILFRNPRGGLVSGYRVDVDPSEPTLSGSLYDEGDATYLKHVEGEPHSQFAFKPGAWNYCRVMADGETLRVWVNGVTTARVTDGSRSSGVIGLKHRGGGGTIRFRDLRVKPLGDDGPD